MHESTWGRVKFLVKLMFCRLGKFDGPKVGGASILGGLYSGC